MQDHCAFLDNNDLVFYYIYIYIYVLSFLLSFFGDTSTTVLSRNPNWNKVYVCMYV